jgi:hypothetical protein
MLKTGVLCESAAEVPMPYLDQNRKSGRTLAMDHAMKSKPEPKQPVKMPPPVKIPSANQASSQHKG